MTVIHIVEEPRDLYGNPVRDEAHESNDEPVETSAVAPTATPEASPASAARPVDRRDAPANRGYRVAGEAKPGEAKPPTPSPSPVPSKLLIA